MARGRPPPAQTGEKLQPRTPEVHPIYSVRWRSFVNDLSGILQVEDSIAQTGSRPGERGDGPIRLEQPTLTPFEMNTNDRRTNSRFQIRRELRYKVLGKGKGKALQSGAGSTVDIGSGGVAFHADQPLAPGTSIELSISWPALLDEVCPMRLSVVGLILRVDGLQAVCTVDRHEFRTQGMLRTPALVKNDAVLQRRMVGGRPRSSAAGA